MEIIFKISILIGNYLLVLRAKEVPIHTPLPPTSDLSPVPDSEPVATPFIMWAMLGIMSQHCVHAYKA